MTCYYPRLMYEDNKKRLKLGDRNNTGRPIMKVPCGECIGCRLDYAKQWSIRIMHESKLYKENCFVTLTYNDENYPKNGSLDREHFQKFMKRLRRRYEPKLIRFYACGEYGEKLGRPHYHAIIFNHNFSDKILRKKGHQRTRRFRLQDDIDFSLYTSEELDKIWKKGFCRIGECSEKSAGYVARYVTKKVNGEKAKKWYKGKEPEFALMSRGSKKRKTKGIGKGWFDKYKGDIYPKDYFTINGKKYKPPKYYDRLYMRYCADKDEEYCTFEDYEEIKRKRKEMIKEETQKRLHEKCKHKKLITKTLIRSYENG